MITVAFFNNKGGVGKTTLVFHLAWMFESMGVRVLAADLDPQANLSTMCLDDDRLMELMPETGTPSTVLQGVQPIIEGTGDIAPVHTEALAEGLHLLVGDMGLSVFEDGLSDAWPKCLDGRHDAVRTTTALHRIVQGAAASCGAEITLIDVGPNLGALNRAALIAADYVIVPLVPDLFSLRGLSNLGPTLRDWRKGWNKRLEEPGVQRVGIDLPRGLMRPVGYVVSQHAVVRYNHPTRAYEQWIGRIPERYARAVFPHGGSPAASTPDDDFHCLATLRHYRSLMAMAMDARRPVFSLRPADGAIGSHAEAVRRARGEFDALARTIADRVNFAIR